MPRFQPEQIFRILSAHDVRYLVVGMLGATLHGSPLRTGDADICPATDADNLSRLSDALREMGATMRGQVDPFDPLGEVPFPFEASRLADARGSILLSTAHGDLDLVFRPDGTGGYDDLVQRVTRYDVGDGLVVPVAALEDIIRSKEAAGRPKDHQALPTLRTLLDSVRKQSGQGS
jgi:hypothetical protein